MIHINNMREAKKLHSHCYKSVAVSAVKNTCAISNGLCQSNIVFHSSISLCLGN